MYAIHWFDEKCISVVTLNPTIFKKAYKWLKNFFTSYKGNAKGLLCLRICFLLLPRLVIWTKIEHSDLLFGYQSWVYVVVKAQSFPTATWNDLFHSFNT